MIQVRRVLRLRPAIRKVQGKGAFILHPVRPRANAGAIWTGVVAIPIQGMAIQRQTAQVPWTGTG